MKINYKKIDIESWDRREAYLCFREFENPYTTVNFDLNIGQSFSLCKKQGLSFFDLILFHVSSAANKIENFRYRFRKSDVILHDVIHPGWVVLNENKSISTSYCEHSNDFIDFSENRTKNVITLGFGESDESLDYLLFTSCTPWLDFCSVSQPYKNSKDSIPRIVWGQCHGESLKFSIQVNHALVDAWHIAEFKKLMEKEIQSFF